MQIKAPIKKIHQHLLVNHLGQVWAYYKVKPLSITYSNGEEIEQAKRTLAHVLQQLEKYKDVHLLLLPRDMNLAERLSKMEKDFDPQTEAIGKYYTEETVRVLEQECKTITEEAYYIGVCLPTSWQMNWKEVAAQVADKVLQAFGMDFEIEEGYFTPYKEMEREVHQIVAKMDAVPVMEDELYYIYRYNYLRATSQSVKEESKTRDFYTIEDTILNAVEDIGFLRLTNQLGTCVTTCIPVCQTPLSVEHLHLFQMAQNMSFPLELHVKAHIEVADKVKMRTNRTKRRLKETADEAYTAGDNASDAVLTGSYVLNKLENDNEAGMPLLKWLACFVISAKNKTECKERADHLIWTLACHGIEAVRPLADQLPLFYKLMTGEPLGKSRWVQHTNVTGFAENLFAVSNRLGNNVGFYIGRVDSYLHSTTLTESILNSRKFVFYHPFVANKGIAGAKTDSPHIAVTGETGKGKSFLIKYLFMYLSFLRTKLLYIDPKKEVRGWFHNVTENKEMQQDYPLFITHLRSFRFVTLDANDSNNHGVLDPLVFLTGVEAHDTAFSMLDQIYSLEQKDAVKSAVLDTIEQQIEQRQKGKQVGMLHVIEQLCQHELDEVKQAGKLIRRLIKNSILALAFSDGSNQGLSLTSKISILEVSGLDLPKEGDDPTHFTDTERKSLALMLPLGKFCEKFGAGDPKQQTAEIFDEAWIFNVAKGGKKILKSMKRVGRSMNNMLIYGTQSVIDIHDESDHGNFGAVFAFDERTERTDILQHLGLESTEIHQKMLAEMIKGQCFYRDIYGRVGKISIDCPFAEMELAFQTIDKTSSSQAEESYA